MAKSVPPRAKSSAATAEGSTTRKKSSPGASTVNNASTVNGASAVEDAPRQPPVAVASEPSHEQIAERAYGLWLSRGAHDGDAFSDWVRAERELRTKN